MSKPQFISNFNKFISQRRNKNEDSIYKTAESLNSPNLDLLDATLNTTLNSTINLDDNLVSLTPNEKSNDFSVPFNHVLSADQIIINKELGKGKRSSILHNNVVILFVIHNNKMY